MPDIFWDGVLPLSQIILGQPKDEQLIINEETSTSFITISPIKYMLGFSEPIKTNKQEFNGEIVPLNSVVIESF